MNEIFEREIISFRGTRQGILMSILENEPFANVFDNLLFKMEANPGFFEGSPVSLDLGWREMEVEELDELLQFFSTRGIKLLGVISSSLNTRRLCEDKGLKVIIGRLGLADHHGSHKHTSRPRPERASENTSGLISQGDAAESRREAKTAEETLLEKKTVRSGQSVEHSGNLVIMGDVNPGGEVRAGGDLFIIGTLRGMAQAGAGQKAESSSIVALKFQPTQIRIGDVLVNKFDGKYTRSKQPVIVHLKNGKIEFQIYQ
jgi:septum site-determining protein MinC